MSDAFTSILGVNYGRMICVSNSTEQFEIKRGNNAKPDFLKMISSKFELGQSWCKSWILRLTTNCFILERGMFIEK